MEIHVNEDVVLRQLQKQDALDIFKLIDSQREYLGVWLPFVEYTHVLENTQSFVDAIVNAPEDSFEYIFTIRFQGKCIGLLGFRDSDWQNHKTEIGYWLSEDMQGRGIITNSVRSLCLFAFEELNMNRIQIKCAVGNNRSIKVPLRLGFTLDGRERDGELLSSGQFTDLKVFSLLRSEYNNSSKQ